MSSGYIKNIYLEEGWGSIKKGITKLTNILEGLPEPEFCREEYLKIHSTVFYMCTQRGSRDFSQPLYDRCRESIEEYIISKVLPPLREKHDEFLLRELVKRWENHQVMVKWLFKCFRTLEWVFIPLNSLAPIYEVGMTCFRDLVFKELNGKVRDAVISLIFQAREGEQIDRALLKNVSYIFVEIGMELYENDFEAAILKDTSTYYSRKVSNWIVENSFPDYVLKADCCLKREKDRVAPCLHYSSEPKLLKKVQNELYRNQLFKEELSRCHASIRDNKHVTSEGMALVHQAEDAASN